MNLTVKHIKTITGFDFGSAVKVAHPVGHLCKRIWIQIAVQKCGSDGLDPASELKMGAASCCYHTETEVLLAAILLTVFHCPHVGSASPTSIPLGSEGGAGEIV